MASVRAVVCWQGRVLFLQRCESGSRPGQWCLPGGTVHADETPEEAILRETFEEAGLETIVKRQLQLLGSCQYFLCELQNDEPVIQLNLSESQNHIWAEPARLLDIGMLMDYRHLQQLLPEFGANLPAQTDLP